MEKLEGSCVDVVRMKCVVCILCRKRSRPGSVNIIVNQSSCLPGDFSSSCKALDLDVVRQIGGAQRALSFLQYCILIGVIMKFSEQFVKRLSSSYCRAVVLSKGSRLVKLSKQLPTRGLLDSLNSFQAQDIVCMEKGITTTGHRELAICRKRRMDSIRTRQRH